ncbi:lytic transglycosylase domain-containing protein [Xylophilus sp. GW821-FHT01B05]
MTRLQRLALLVLATLALSAQAEVQRSRLEGAVELITLHAPRGAAPFAAPRPAPPRSDYAALAQDAAQRTGLDAPLIRAVMHAESAFNATAVSPKGAQGLMQLMPATAALYGVQDAYDPRQNVLAGASHLRYLLQRFGQDIPLALAAYNAGEGAVERYDRRIPPYAETRGYVERVLALRERYLAGDAAPASAPARRPAATGSPAGPLWRRASGTQQWVMFSAP